MFTAPVSYQPQDEGVAPLRSIHCYRSDQEALGRCNKLRGAGLSEREVELAVEGGANRGVGVEPSALQTQMATIQRVHRTTVPVCCNSSRGAVPVEVVGAHSAAGGGWSLQWSTGDEPACMGSGAKPVPGQQWSLSTASHHTQWSLSTASHHTQWSFSTASHHTQ